MKPYPEPNTPPDHPNCRCTPLFNHDVEALTLELEFVGGPLDGNVATLVEPKDGDLFCVPCRYESPDCDVDVGCHDYRIDLAHRVLRYEGQA
jgi:hypothetical protein